MNNESSSSSLSKNTLLFTVGNLMTSAIPFLLMPLLTRRLSPEDYGIISMFQILIGFFSPFIGLSIHGAFERKYYHKSKSYLSSYLTNGLYVLFASTVLFLLILPFMSNIIGSLTNFPQKWLWVVMIVGAGRYLNLVLLSIWQLQIKVFKYISFQLFQSSIIVSLVLIFVVGLGMNWEGRIIAELLSITCTIIIGLIILRENGWLKSGVKRVHIASVLSFGIPVIPHAIGGWITSATDRILLSNMMGIDQVGIYSVALQFAFIITTIQLSFNTAFVPWLFGQLAKNDKTINRKIVKITYGIIAVSTIAISIFIIIIPHILSIIVGEKFVGANVFIFWLGIGQGIRIIYFLTCNYIFYSGKTKYLAYATSFSSLIHVITTYYLININGAVGAAQAAVVSSSISAALVWYFAAKAHKMPWLLKV